ncbi:MAG TPA: hypothetical protein VGB42_07565 [Candidatus Thermoplasmatota archaeon]
MGIKRAFPEFDPYYVDAHPRTVRTHPPHFAVFGDPGALSGQAQLAIVDPAIGDAREMEELLNSLAASPALGDPLVMNVFTGGAAAVPSQHSLRWYLNDPVVETAAVGEAWSPGRLFIEGTEVETDFRTLAFGPYGPGYPMQEERAALEAMAETGLLQAEALRGLVMVACASWSHLSSVRSNPCSMPWISSVLSLLYAKTHVEFPGHIGNTGRGYHWLSPIDPIHEELVGAGLLEISGNSLILTEPGEDYLRTLIIPVLRPQFGLLYEELPRLVDRHSLVDRKPWHITDLIGRQGDGRFPRDLS